MSSYGSGPEWQRKKKPEFLEPEQQPSIRENDGVQYQENDAQNPQLTTFPPQQQQPLPNLQSPKQQLNLQQPPFQNPPSQNPQRPQFQTPQQSQFQSPQQSQFQNPQQPQFQNPQQPQFQNPQQPQFQNPQQPQFQNPQQPQFQNPQQPQFQNPQQPQFPNPQQPQVQNPQQPQFQNPQQPQFQNPQQPQFQNPQQPQFQNPQQPQLQNPQQPQFQNPQQPQFQNPQQPQFQNPQQPQFQDPQQPQFQNPQQPQFQDPQQPQFQNWQQPQFANPQEPQFQNPQLQMPFQEPVQPMTQNRQSEYQASQGQYRTPTQGPDGQWDDEFPQPESRSASRPGRSPKLQKDDEDDDAPLQPASWEKKLNKFGKYSEEDEQIPSVRIEFSKRMVSLGLDLVCAYLIAFAVSAMPIINSYLGNSLVMTLFLLFRDHLCDGRGVGKNLMGLRVVDIKTRRGCTLMQSVKRNVIILGPLIALDIVALALQIVHSVSQGVATQANAINTLTAINNSVQGIVHGVCTAYVFIVIPYEIYRVYSRPDGRRFGDQLAGTRIVEAPMDFSRILARN